MSAIRSKRLTSGIRTGGGGRKTGIGAGDNDRLSLDAILGV
jgi:hypothetical protein